jgi:RNA polymerase sigma-B factor
VALRPPDQSDQPAVDALLRQYHENRDPQVRERIVEAYFDFAVGKAWRYADRGVELADLRQVALVGLLHAVERFDPDRGVQFTSFATPTIVGELRRHFRDRTWDVRVSRRHQELSRRAGLAADRLSQQLGRRPGLAEIAAELRVDVDSLIAAMDASRAYRSVSLDAPTGDDDGDGAGAAMFGGPDPRLERTPVVMDLRRLLGELPERERTIMRLRYEGGMSQKQIADQVGLSQMHVSRLLRRILAQLRSHLA